MERLRSLIDQIDQINFSGKQKCIESLDNRLQDVLLFLQQINIVMSGEYIDLKLCSWVLHERYHMDNDEDLKWTFHHTKHRILKNCNEILQVANSKRKSA